MFVFPAAGRHWSPQFTVNGIAVHPVNVDYSENVSGNKVKRTQTDQLLIMSFSDKIIIVKL